MIWVDYAILAIIGLSALISIWRGLIREVLSLLAWILAILVAVTFMRPLADLLTPYISVPSARLIIAFMALFIATLLCGALINFIIGKLVMSSGLSGTDRVLGIVFGTARGALVVGVLVLMARLTPLPQDPWWEQSVLLGRFEAMALWLRSYLPPEVAAYFTF
ncbi:MAG: CvpA family protein [Gammaproteobacteria bacterium]|nr:CvpA family protein [Gammaproteobacteria bacterium]